MARLIQDLVYAAATRAPHAPAMCAGGALHDYAALAARIRLAGAALRRAGAGPGERVAVWLEPCLAAVHALLGAAAAGAVMVPVDPGFLPGQAAAVLRASGARVLVTDAARAAALASLLPDCAVRTVLVCGGRAGAPPGTVLAGWEQAPAGWEGALASAASMDGDGSVDPGVGTDPYASVDADASADADGGTGSGVAALLYVAGADGQPAGVSLTHHGLVDTAASTVRSLGLVAGDRVLAALPFNFDFGLNQLIAAFAAGAALLLPGPGQVRDLAALAVRERASVLAAQASTWAALARRDWSGARLRCAVSVGGAVPVATIEALRRALPRTRIHLVYGLPEAYCATCLAPGQGAPGAASGRAPRAGVLLLHPGRQPAAPSPAGGGAIRICGHRVIPGLVEQVVYGTGLVEEAAAIAVAHPVLGQVIAVLATPRRGARLDSAILFGACRARLPGYMLPAMVDVRRAPLPRGANGKIDRALLAGELAPLFAEATP